jgi:serine O-acetyltransferase
VLFYYRIGDAKFLISFLAPCISNFIISKGAKIGTGILFFHSYSTIINAYAVGENCRILHNVTLGFKNGKTPTILDNVEIFSNTVIVGGITIGNNCVIGPGAVVVKSIPDNCVVVGNPSYILKQDGVIVNKKL